MMEHMAHFISTVVLIYDMFWIHNIHSDSDRIIYIKAGGKIHQILAFKQFPLPFTLLLAHILLFSFPTKLVCHDLESGALSPHCLEHHCPLSKSTSIYL